MPDQKIVCTECGQEFDFTEGEQKFFIDKGFPAPIRCPECRKAKKANGNNKKQKEKISI